jgi:hypothetical protein
MHVSSIQGKVEIRILILVVGYLSNHVAVVMRMVLDKVHLELTLRQRISIEMSYEMRHIIIELHHLFRNGLRRSSGCR